MSKGRMALFGIGALGIGYGAWLVLSTQRIDQVVGVAVWLAAAVIVHDGILVPLLTVARARMRGRRSGTRTRGRSETSAPPR